ncbi:MAG TPA: hypothetical protein VE136_10570 [Anaerolineales bacterium]|nr:hypothetical protein [Anaerolineales bacterium]
MPNSQDQNYPVLYEIQVSGRIDLDRASWFGDMALDVKRTPDGAIVSVLSGEVPYHAALFGILARIRDLGIKLISVNRIGANLEIGNGDGKDLREEEAK